MVLSLSSVSYVFGLLIAKHPKRGWIHSLAVILVLAVLVVFKYLGFLTGILNSLASFTNALPQFEITKLLLPLGISYIVFKHISYLTDIKWGLVKPGKFVDFLLYSSLFTIFVAGPIERFERFKPQAEQQRLPFSWEYIEYGFMRIVFGMFKKLVLADNLAILTGKLTIEASFGVPAYAIHLIAYSLQIYLDFSGYSDIAIGSSRLLGLKIMENFNNPYLAQNISQFWRRWHISLSDWIRDYLFFPLSRFRTGVLWNIALVPIMAMALCGLWHGSSWAFVIWGVWHGLGLTVYQTFQHIKRARRRRNLPRNAQSVHVHNVVFTFIFVSLGWILFDVNSTSLIFNIDLTAAGIGMFSKRYLGLMGVSGLSVFMGAPLMSKLIDKLPHRYRAIVNLAAFAAMVETILLFAGGGSAFVYAGF